MYVNLWLNHYLKLNGRVELKVSKAIKFQAPKVRDAFLQLSKCYQDSKIKSEAMCLATYDIRNFEFY